MGEQSIGHDPFLDLRLAAMQFLDSTVHHLRSDHVLPIPRGRPRFLRSYRDYFPGPWGNDRERSQFEEALERAFPHRFDDALGPDTKIASQYTYSFAELCIAEAHARNEPHGAGAPSASGCFDRLISELEAPKADFVICRGISNLTTATGQPLEFAGIEVHPIDAPQVLTTILQRELPKFNPRSLRRSGSPYGKRSVLVARETEGSEWANEEVERKIGRRLDRFVLLVLLRYGPTLFEDFQVKGRKRLIGTSSPQLDELAGEPSIRRTAALAPSDVTVLEEMGEFLDPFRFAEEDVVVDPIIVALNKLSLSYVPHGWWDQLVGLMTGLEAALSGKEAQDVGLRVKNRAAVLLSTEEDPAGVIFEDLHSLYSLRSAVVHGSEVKRTRFDRTVRRHVSNEDSFFGAREEVEVMLDRLRDLLRRSILARTALMSGSDPLWPASKDGVADLMVVSDSARHMWVDAWHEVWSGLGADGIWKKCASPLSELTRDPDQVPLG